MPRSRSWKTECTHRWPGPLSWDWRLYHKINAEARWACPGDPVSGPTSGAEPDTSLHQAQMILDTGELQKQDFPGPNRFSNPFGPIPITAMGRPHSDLVLPTTKYERVLDSSTLSYKPPRADLILISFCPQRSMKEC